jgi:nicotinate phosphoribosyltransferase
VSGSSAALRTAKQGQQDDRAVWVGRENVALLTDLYELTMLQAYWREDLDEEAVFSLFVRRLPEHRNYLLACGLGDVFAILERLRFTDEALDFLSGRDEFSSEFVDWLSDFTFDGDVFAVREGTPVFADEPLLEVVAPIAQAQLVETVIMNQVHFQTVLASKATRMVTAAHDRSVVDFGLRRMHGADAGLKAARAFHIAGVAATSNVLAGHLYGVPITGTMAHSYIQAHDSEADAFRAFADLYPSTILLVDTYDTLEGVRQVARLAAERGNDFRVDGIRLDSGDLAQLAVESRAILDEAGLKDVKIFASGGLNEYGIARMLEADTPIQGFGVGTGMGVSEDHPALDIAYKLTAYAGKGRLKLSSGKRILPGRKQVFRYYEDDGSRATRDVIARTDERHDGEPLLQRAMQAGKRLPAADVTIDEARDYAREQIDRLADRVRGIEPADPPFPVELSPALKRYRDEVTREIQSGERRR